MMVEAGGTEDSWEFYEAGAPRSPRRSWPQGLESAKTWIRESIELQRRARGQGRARSPRSPTSSSPTTSDDVYERVDAVGTDAVAKANAITAKAERNAALDEATDVDHGRTRRRVPRAGA